MTDASLEWQGDFSPDATGDLQMVDGDDEVRQRLERRLFTPQHGYIWHPTYGAGLPQKIGSVLTEQQIRSVVASQLAMEASVAPFPPPVLTVSAQPGGNVIIGIKYFDAAADRSVSFQITS